MAVLYEEKQLLSLIQDNEINFIFISKSGWTILSSYKGLIHAEITNGTDELFLPVWTSGVGADSLVDDNWCS